MARTGLVISLSGQMRYWETRRIKGDQKPLVICGEDQRLVVVANDCE